MSQPVPCAASTLLAGLLDDPGPGPLVEVARTPVSVHYETGRDDVPVLCVAAPAAVRLPNTLLVARLPETPGSWRVTRWWQPHRPTGLHAPTRPLTLEPGELLGAGPGLTPAGDDVLAGALVAAFAFGHPQLERLRDGVRRALHWRRTTAVSRGLLRHALDGWCIPQLADHLEALAAGCGTAATEAALRSVGHSSGAALLQGVHQVVDAAAARGAA